MLDTDAGDVDIITWDKEEVLVKVDIEGSDRRSDKFDVKFSENPDRISIIGKANDHSFFKWDVGDLDVRFHVTVPKKYSVKASTSGGNMTLRNLVGDVRFETSGGNLTIDAVDGTVDINTSGGNIDVTKIKGTL